LAGNDSALWSGVRESGAASRLRWVASRRLHGTPNYALQRSCCAAAWHIS